MKDKSDNSDRIGHRERQRQRFLNSDIKKLSDRDLLEMILFYSLPRVDTKPIANELIKKYVTLPNILDADPDELSKVTGIKTNSLVLFRLIKETASRCRDGRVFGNFLDPDFAKAYLKDLFGNAETELVYALFLDEQGSLLNKQLIFRGGISSAKFSLRPVTEGSIRSGGNTVIVAHNHPSGSSVPSGEDIHTTKLMASYLLANEITLAEHYVVGKNSVTGIIGTEESF